MRAAFLLSLGILTAVSAACDAGGEGAPDWGGTVRDSAGVTVVTNPPAPLWSPAEGWWVEETLRVGGDPAVPEALFGYVADVALDPEGRLYVLDQQARAVRVFDRDGSYLHSLGGPGEGPGELGALATSVVVRDGEVWVADWTQSRMNRYGADGTVLPSFPLPHAGGARSWWEEGADGAVYARTLSMAPGPGGAWEGRDHLLRLSGEPDAPVSADTVLSFEYAAADLGARGAPRLPPVVNAPAWTVLPSGAVAWTTLEAAEVRLLGPGGTERLIRSAAWAGHPPSDGEKAALRVLVGERLEMLGGSAEAVNQLPVDFPGSLPVLTDLRAGPEGTLWVQRAGSMREVHPMALNTPDPPRGWGGTAWEVLSPEGRYLGTLELPPRFRVMGISDSTVVGVQSDLLRVDHVLLLDLHRPSPED
ncbi:MAG TPA: 6-bladed beta-propeller [Longimicrobiales bacterium]|nr:6-bladed beta-propeller [Longimicrobiales bacterium]